MDLTAVTRNIDNDGNICYGTGLAFEIPEGYVGLVFPRSSNCKKDIIVTNSVGVIDSGYRGEVTLKFKGLDGRVNKMYDEEDFTIKNSIFGKAFKVGDRIGQIIIMPYPHIEFEEVEELSETERGTEGYGSSGN